MVVEDCLLSQEAVVGSMLLDSQVIGETLEYLREEDFLSARCRLLCNFSFLLQFFKESRRPLVCIRMSKINPTFHLWMIDYFLQRRAVIIKYPIKFTIFMVS